MIGSRICGGNSQYKRNEIDFYPTPPNVTIALMKFLNLPQGTNVWEPACGEGHMVQALEACGMCVKGTDISHGEDFLEMPLPRDISWIITNPPFSIADKFIERAAKHGTPFAFLLKSQYWHAAKRYKLFEQNPPAYILPLTWRPDFCFKKRGGGSPLMDVMWCVWLPCQDRHTQYTPLQKPKEET